MNNKYIKIFIGILIVVVVVVLVWESRSNKIGNRGSNPFEYNYDEFKTVDPELIGYSEYRQISLEYEKPKGVFVSGDQIYLIGDSKLRVIDKNGNESLNLSLEEAPKAIAANKKRFIIAYERFFELRTADGETKFQSENLSDSTFITSVAISGEKIYIADAGKRKVMVFDLEGKRLSEMGGISGVESLHGFIIPSANFDLALNRDEELWVVNPGMHALQHYNDQGDLMNFWEKASMKVDGFSGCCNPAHFTFLENGHFITSEKGLVRIKEYDAKGKLISVVASPDKFKEGGQAPDVAADTDGIVYALDKDKKILRMFKPKQN